MRRSTTAVPVHGNASLPLIAIKKALTAESVSPADSSLATHWIRIPVLGCAERIAQI